MPHKARDSASAPQPPPTSLQDIEAFLSLVAQHPGHVTGAGYLDEADFERAVALDRAVGEVSRNLGLALPVRPDSDAAESKYLPHTNLRYYWSKPGTDFAKFASGPLRAQLAPSALWLAEMRAFRQEAAARLRSEPPVADTSPSRGRQVGVPSAPSVRLSPREQEIVDLLREKGRRLTTTQILEELEKRGKIPSVGTTKNALATLVRNNTLNSRQDTRGRGYGLPEWG
jgi:hypothetical protein